MESRGSWSRSFPCFPSSQMGRKPSRLSSPAVRAAIVLAVVSLRVAGVGEAAVTGAELAAQAANIVKESASTNEWRIGGLRGCEEEER